MSGSREEEVLARIAEGRVYTESEAAFQAPRRRTDQIFEYNRTPPGEAERRRALLVEIFGAVGERTVLLPPFHAGFGSNVHIGDDFFGNVNLTFVDDVDIHIGNDVMIAPSVTLNSEAETLKSLVAGFSVSGGHSSQQLRATAAAMRAPAALARAQAAAPRARPRTSGANALAQDDWTEF